MNKQKYPEKGYFLFHGSDSVGYRWYAYIRVITYVLPQY